MKRISWRDLGRILPAGASTYARVAEGPQQLIFLGMLLHARGARAITPVGHHECFVLNETVEVNWEGFAEAIADAMNLRR